MMGGWGCACAPSRARRAGPRRRFLRERYGIGPVGQGLRSVIPQKWDDDGSTFFFSERMNRNVQSLEALLSGLFPLGTGTAGFQCKFRFAIDCGRSGSGSFFAPLLECKEHRVQRTMIHSP